MLVFHSGEIHAISKGRSEGVAVSGAGLAPRRRRGAPDTFRGSWKIIGRVGSSVEYRLQVHVGIELELRCALDLKGLNKLRRALDVKGPKELIARAGNGKGLGKTSWM